MQMGRCCHCDPPPVLMGRIYRFVYPSAFPADYAAISTASWSTGTTGNPTEDFNCRYVTLSTPNRRETSADIITDPVRFSVYGPASDSGTFDYWMASTVTGSTQLRLYQFGASDFGFHPVTDGMIPLGCHAEWLGGELVLDVATGTIPAPARAETTEPNLYIAGALSHALTIHAFAHRVNGAIVGSVHVAPFSAADYICSIADGDSYEVDIWYKMSFTASSGLPATPGSVIRWLHTTRVSNGSRRLTKGQRPVYMISFQNANFSPAFDVSTHTYQVSISGHAGWYLLSGSNGPITVTNYAGQWYGEVGERFALLRTLGPHPIHSMTLFWDREVAMVVVRLPGLSVFSPPRHYLYRSTTASAQYRSETTSTDIGSVDHAQYGFFNQASTTVFEYIEWNTGFVSGSFDIGMHDGAYSSASLPTKPAELPQTITFTRIARGTSEQIYTSGSGTFTVPAGVFLLTRELWGPGGGGGAGVAGAGNRSGSGGSGGGYCTKNASAVTPGQAIAYSVGAPGDGGTYDNDDSTAGSATTTDGGTYTANGGGRGRSGGGIAADPPGTASGGDINTTGTIGSTNPTNVLGGAGGAGANGGAGGAGGVVSVSLAVNGTAPGGGGGGGGDNSAVGAGDTADGGDGGAGKIRFSW